MRRQHHAAPLCGVPRAWRAPAAALLLLLLLAAAAVARPAAAALHLDDTFRNDYGSDSPHPHSSVYEALEAAGEGAGAALHARLELSLQAPSFSEPPLLPYCLPGRKLARALAAAINTKYGSDLSASASVDASYTQARDACAYSCLVTLWGPDAVKEELVAAAATHTLCELLPSFCMQLDIVPALSDPQQRSHTSTSSSSSTPHAAHHHHHDDDGGHEDAAHHGWRHKKHRRAFKRRPSIAADNPFVLVSSAGSANPELPPVLQYGCKRFTFDQALDHFAQPDKQQQQPSGSRDGDSTGPAAVRTAAEGSDATQEEQQQPEQPVLPPLAAIDTGNQTFKQVYWVCDGAWPSHRTEQSSSGNVLVFLGNESPLGVPGQPIVFENARRLNALVVLVEHRYYGESLPFSVPPGETLPTSHYKWLTMAQVIEDTAAVVQHVRAERGVPASVPAVVVGGSYGGMIASYHRVVRPDVFDAAIAASAPIHYITDTPMWAGTSHKYHQFIEDAVATMSGSAACSDAIRAGLAEMLERGATPEGRQEVASAFSICNVTQSLPDAVAIAAFQRDIISTYQGIAQVNNQPPLLGQMALACEVLLGAASSASNGSSSSGGSAMAGLAAVERFFFADGSETWCRGFSADEATRFVPDYDEDGYKSYTWQCCAEGSVFSSGLPAAPGDAAHDVLNPAALPVAPQGVADNCRHVFGPDMPALAGPPFAKDIHAELRRLGGVVFTNGDLDGWSGGSLGLEPRLRQGQEQSEEGASTAPGALKQQQQPQQQPWQWPADDPRLAFIVYANASHCTDTHLNTWGMKDEPPAWREQRALAVDIAVSFAQQHQQRALAAAAQA